ncbi:hypothetical protein [Nocardia abscessus]|uniref:hypothetical protein n=1 Tax=Nocardia abscessus TaxID=120957 RepID=UPI0024537581|nr:hypothetical protein [Nocardia abscessus]
MLIPTPEGRIVQRAPSSVDRLTADGEGGQPFVITYGATLLAAARAFFAEQLRRADDLGDIDPDA